MHHNIFLHTKLTLILCYSNVIVAFQEACSLGLDDIVQIFFEYTGNDLITKKGANGKFNGLNALQIATMNRRNLVVQTLLRRYQN